MLIPEMITSKDQVLREWWTLQVYIWSSPHWMAGKRNRISFKLPHLQNFSSAFFRAFTLIQEHCQVECVHHTHASVLSLVITLRLATLLLCFADEQNES